MGETVIKKILSHNANRFKTAFTSSAKDLYFDENQKLFHAAEFGRYRENLTCDFLRSFIPGYLGIKNGFIVSPISAVSTQCDVIFFDKELTPIIKDDHNNQFFPSDCIKGVGEVKSDMTKKQLLDALLKLSEIKKITASISDEVTGLNTVDYDRSLTHNHAYTFLICNKINWNTTNLSGEISEFYDDEGVPHEYRHSFILSLDGKASFYSAPDIDNCGYPYIKFKKDHEPLASNPVHILNDFEKAINAFAQITFTTIAMQQRMIMNIMSYIK